GSGASAWAGSSACWASCAGWGSTRARPRRMAPRPRRRKSDMAKIAHIELLPVIAEEQNPTDADGSTETLVVRITDENGLTGIGECDAASSVVRAFLDMPTAHMGSQNVVGLLVGADPLERTALWEKPHEATLYPGRRGLGIHALSAVDIAVHDLAA